MLKAARILPLLAVLALALPATASAAAGDLDPSFDGDGKRTIDYGGDEDAAMDVAVQPDGRIVLAGRGNVNADVAIQRLLPDGSGDPSFDLDGSLGIDFGGRDGGRAVALQPDGKILVAGDSLTSSGLDLAIARVNADGSADPTFDGDGKRTIDYGVVDGAMALALRPDGRIVVAGYGNADSDFAIHSLLPDGSGDPSFDLEGSLGINMGGADYGYATALQPDGKILVAGSTSKPGDSDMAIVRVNPDGSLDSSFDGDGKRTIEFGGLDHALALALQPDGRIVLVGQGSANSDIGIVRLLPDGTGDPSFNLDGARWVDLGGAEQGLAVALQPDGKILAAGFASDGVDSDFVVLRVHPGGSLDTTFAGDGTRTIDYGVDAGAMGIALQPDGRIVVAGRAGHDLAVARLLGDPRAPDGPGPVAPGMPSAVPRCAGRTATIVGTGARDRLRGTPRADVIVALGGNDVISGGRGNDLICAGAGNDRVRGDSGGDRLFGQSGKDRLNGGAGKDLLNGGPERDRCLGGRARDRARTCETSRSI